MPQWQRFLGQGSRAVRSPCHTSLQAGHGQPLAQLGVLKTQGSAANLQGCLPWLFSNQLCLAAFLHLCLAVAWWSGGCVGVTAKLTKQHDGTFVGSLKRRSHQKSSLCVLSCVQVLERASTMLDVQYKYCMTKNKGSCWHKITCIILYFKMKFTNYTGPSWPPILISIFVFLGIGDLTFIWLHIHIWQLTKCQSNINFAENEWSIIKVDTDKFLNLLFKLLIKTAKRHQLFQSVPPNNSCMLWRK